MSYESTLIIESSTDVEVENLGPRDNAAAKRKVAIAERAQRLRGLREAAAAEVELIHTSPSDAWPALGPSAPLA